MKVAIKGLLLVVALLAYGQKAEAYPVLQLDIIGGYYDYKTNTVISRESDFTLVALLTPREGYESRLFDTYYISAAVVPKTGPIDLVLGSFTWNDTPYQATADMTYGVPPLEQFGDQGYDPGDLYDGEIFPTFFREFGPFQFSPDLRALSYDTEFPSTGSFTPTSETGPGVSYYQTFNISSALDGEFVLHFDLYGTYLKNCAAAGSCNPDLDVDYFADSHHDAQEGSSSQIPEPASLLALGLGLAVAARQARRLTT